MNGKIHFFWLLTLYQPEFVCKVNGSPFNTLFCRHFVIVFTLNLQVLEMQDQLKLLHQKSVQFEQQSRSRANSLQGPANQTRSPASVRRNTQPSGARAHSRQASIGASSDVSAKDGYLTSPRISRRSSTDNLSIHSHGRASQPSPNGHVRRPSGSMSGAVWSPSDSSSAFSMRHPSGSVQSISSQAFWRPGATSDLGSSTHGGSSQEITVVAKMVDDGAEGGLTGINCLKALVSLLFHLSLNKRAVIGQLVVRMPQYGPTLEN